MPRGVPNARRDETGFRYTTYHVPLALNPKHMTSSYLRSESQTVWARNATRSRHALLEEFTPHEVRRGSQVIVIHPGSRYLRIGRASDVNPVTVPNVIARKTRSPPPPTFVQGVSRPARGQSLSRRVTVASETPEGDEYAVSVSSDDPFDEKIAAITLSLRERMKFYKLRVTPNAARIASTFNDQFRPEVIPEENDLFRPRYIMEPPADECLIGDKALLLSDPQALGYVMRWPIYGGNFNTRDYPSHQLILDDIETILRGVLREGFDLNGSSLKDYSVILVIPDFYEKTYVRDWVNLLLVSMGFKQICVQQESLAATYGAGIPNACVVDIGATVTSIACVDEGMVIADTRMSLNMGGNDITEFLHVLLSRIHFPYKEADLARWYDWSVMEELKAKLCTLTEADVSLSLYDLIVSRPGKPAVRYGLRAYDEVILAPMCVFEPRVIEFDRKRVGMVPASSPDVTEDTVDRVPEENVTQAMLISTQHLLPVAPPPVLTPPETLGSPQKPTTNGTSTPASEDALQQPPTKTPLALETLADSDAVDIMADNQAPLPPASTHQQPLQPQSQQPSYANGFCIDICFEASKLPLDVAIFNSARSAGGDEKIRKYLQAVLVVGGSALIPGMPHALESRLQAIATPLVPNMEKVQIIPPPKDVDPRILVWKGAAVLGKMEGVSDLWVTGRDWDVLGMRGLKERCFYLNV